MRCVLDTHVWFWWQMAPYRISPNAARLLDPEAGRDLVLPAICVWELAKLVEKGRITLAEPVGQWVGKALAMPGLRLAPLSPEVAVESTCLPGAFHADPADQMVVATARVLQAPLVTADARIRAYPHVTAVW
ncbi:MAG: type II toxin-antitoxin system VapC family toxin [Armatimonadetes bacterium]|nr:type II toxin-antitoxin system VapC family toxin [Armatimonadota bacterium]